MAQSAAFTNVETDMTVQAFAQWLTEMKARNNRTLQEMLAEMSIIRDGITSNNVELTDFKRHSTGISQQMQSQLTDLREKLTNAFGEITSLVKQKTTSDQEMMQDINSLQGNLSCKTAEIENLKRSYSQAHQQLQNSLIQITNHMSVTKSEVEAATKTCDRVLRDTSERLSTIDSNVRGLEETLSVGNAENRNQMLQLQEEIARIHESLTSVSAEFLDHKRSTNSVHNKLQSQVWSLGEGRKLQSPVLPTQAESRATLSFQPVAADATAATTISTQPWYSAGTVPANASSFAPSTHGDGGYSAAPITLEYVNIRGVSMPCYSDQHLLSLHPAKLREHAQMLFRILGHEAAGSVVPAQDGDLFEWVSRVHKMHIEPVRAASASMRTTAAAPTQALLPTQHVSASTLPTQQVVRNTSPAQQVGMQPGTVPSMVTPGMVSRPQVILGRTAGGLMKTTAGFY